MHWLIRQKRHFTTRIFQWRHRIYWSYCRIHFIFIIIVTIITERFQGNHCVGFKYILDESHKKLINNIAENCVKIINWTRQIIEILCKHLFSMELLKFYLCLVFFYQCYFITISNLISAICLRFSDSFQYEMRFSMETDKRLFFCFFYYCCIVMPNTSFTCIFMNVPIHTERTYGINVKCIRNFFSIKLLTH